jgi:uncharacterized protein (DUF1499 family)
MALKTFTKIPHIILFLIPLLGFFVIGCTGVRPKDLGVREGKLAPCPATSNCVSSQSSDPIHAIEPLTISGPVTDAHAALKHILLGMKRTAIITETDTYIHAEFTSAIFRFVDDVEFWFDENGKVIHVRSASRLGQSDLGVNRKRVEDIRARWKAKVN